MTTDEKLQHFLEASMEESRAHSHQIIADYQEALDKIFEGHKEDVLRKARLEIKNETDKIRREGNQKLAREHLHIKRALNQKNTELTEKLFVEVQDMLENYMDTSAYNRLLKKQILDAKAFAGDDEIIIYIDPADISIRRALEEATHSHLTVSQYSFGGGTRAVIPSKNILIDNSFQTKLAEAKENFRFDGGNPNE
ncbi:MAG: V-type ATP synthase subunit E [Lachnospiraceae bacterium]|nr:V-type ATP synthase subunit E [Candidatus Fimimorpha excrementavium]